ncbi:MAG TPA: hypothetical protein VN873_10425 [Candidatus Angelobacter sp.]|nr:hypothetical protein [Candidatus Angelobacter sp.]
MSKPTRYQRPNFEAALAAWKSVLDEHEYPTEILWVLDENLCFERDPGTAGGLKLGIQTQFTSHPPDSAKVIYHHFAEADARLVFYRLGANRNRSVCILLCDEWLEGKEESEGYLRRDEWLISFYPGSTQEIEEITDADRWKNRVIRGRPFSAVDFCMTMAALNELKAHGRVLSPDERFGLQILRSLSHR